MKVKNDKMPVVKRTQDDQRFLSNLAEVLASALDEHAMLSRADSNWPKPATTFPTSKGYPTPDPINNAATTKAPGSRRSSVLLGDEKPKREGNDITGTRVSIGRRGKEWGTGPSMFMGVPITDEISWMTDSLARSFVG